MLLEVSDNTTTTAADAAAAAAAADHFSGWGPRECCCPDSIQHPAAPYGDALPTLGMLTPYMLHPLQGSDRSTTAGHMVHLPKLPAFKQLCFYAVFSLPPTLAVAVDHVVYSTTTAAATTNVTPAAAVAAG